MALDKATLKTSLQTVFDDPSTSTTSAQKAQSIADAIDVFVKSGTVTVNGVQSGGSSATGSVT